MQYRGTVITAVLSIIRCTSSQTYNCVLPNVSTCFEPVSLIGADLSHADPVTLSCDNGKGGGGHVDCGLCIDDRAEQKW